MTDSKQLIEQAAREIAASPTTSGTPPGPNEQRRRGASEAHIEAINQVFALFRLNYHNQYYAAYPDAEQLNQIKKLWLESLQDYPVEQLLRGARHAIETSEYLPTLHRMLESCQQSLASLGLPAPYEAYREACAARSPRSTQRWSHPAVYLAGRDSDWFFLANNPERQTWPVFREHYQRWCSRVLRGEQLELPTEPALERQEPAPLDPQSQLAELRQLRERVEL